MAKKKYLAVDLYEYIEILPQWSIKCSNCGKEEVSYGAVYYDETKELFKNGWRATKGKVYCPSCAHKKLKLQ